MAALQLRLVSSGQEDHNRGTKERVVDHDAEEGPMPREDISGGDTGINPVDPDVQPDDSVVFQQDIALSASE
jgi:hypothetical protein